MNSYLYGILDHDIVYSRLFADGLNKLSRLHNKVLVFTELSSLKLYSRIDKIQLLFVSTDINLGTLSEFFDLNKVIVLSGDSSENSLSSYEFSCPVLLKYDSPEHIFSKATNIISSNNMTETDKNDFSPDFYHKENISSCIISGVISPFSWELQTMAALRTAIELGKMGSTLFIDLTCFSPLYEYCGEGGDFSDLLFYYSHNRSLLVNKFHSLIHSVSGFDFILPPRNLDDLSSFSKELFHACLSYTADELGYDFIVINFTTGIYPLSEYLGCCHMILFPYFSHFNPLNGLKSFLDFSGFSQLKASITELPISSITSYKGCSIDEMCIHSKAFPALNPVSDFAKAINNLKGGTSDDRSN